MPGQASDDFFVAGSGRTMQDVQYLLQIMIHVGKNALVEIEVVNVTRQHLDNSACKFSICSRYFRMLMVVSISLVERL